MDQDVTLLPAISETEIETISVYGARVHNLQNIEIHIPRNKLVVITGISGSGKSSLAFDTIYAEGQRRYMDSFSNYARQFVGAFDRPDVDKITGLSPVISIEQKTTNRNPRSTVGTVTEIYDFLRLLYARVGQAYSYETGKKMIRFSERQIADHIIHHFVGQKIILLAPAVRGRKGHYRELFTQIKKQGFLKVRIDGTVQDIKTGMQVDRFKVHDIEIVVDRLKISGDLTRLASSIDTALRIGNGLMQVMEFDSGKIKSYSKHLMCETSGISYQEPSPNSFSFNSPYGACKTCNGLGAIQEIDLQLIIPDYTKTLADEGIPAIGKDKKNYTNKKIHLIADSYDFTYFTSIIDIPEDALNLILYGSKANSDAALKVQKFIQKSEFNFEGIIPILNRSYNDSSSDRLRKWAENYMSITRCTECKGQRLNKESLHFKINNENISDIAAKDIESVNAWLQSIESNITKREVQIVKDVIKELKERIGFLLDVGLGYLSLDRPARTLSGGESQRIRLATQIGSQLMGITYILDEPSIGLHQRDNERLIQSLQELAKMGNTVLVVEHDKDIMLRSDYLIDLGPGAGKHGGFVVAEGNVEDFMKISSPTADYLSHRKSIEIPSKRRKGNGNKIQLKGCNGNNLQNVSIDFKLGQFICVTGVSGSGKSTLINWTLNPILKKHFYRAKKKPLAYKSIHGIDLIDKVIEIDQSPIGRTPRSNPATYIGAFTEIRSLFAKLSESKIRGYKAGRFSFNVKGGRCETCGGGGMKVIAMNILPDVLVECEVCYGNRYNRETLDVKYKGKNISDVLNMTIDEAADFFESIPKISMKLKTLQSVGLNYITLGQSATTLSGGEAQRVKLSAELSKRDTGNTFYILDEPTTGLHFQDIELLLKVLHELANKGNTVLVIEHNMDVIKTADYIIDIGPEGGSGGGNIVAKGTPEQVCKVKESYTAKFLQAELNLSSLKTS